MIPMQASRATLIALFTVLSYTTGVSASGHGEPDVGITPSMFAFVGTVDGREIRIMRDQDTSNTVKPAYALTSRPCPPFCIQPMQLAPGVETLGELEVIEYVRRLADGDDSVLLIDSRDAESAMQGTIPGAVNIPWSKLNMEIGGADPLTIGEILSERFAAEETDIEDQWDFSQARTLILFCNGMWCGQSPTNIQTLLKLGYPAEKLKWYRGGMQVWEILGMNTDSPL